MKILKMPDTKWSYKHTCLNCTAELEVEKIDVRHYHYDGDQRECTSGYDTWTCTCPVCSAQFNVPENSIPQAVRVEIKQGGLNKTSSYGGPFDR